jgi:hypothetical protein
MLYSSPSNQGLNGSSDIHQLDDVTSTRLLEDLSGWAVHEIWRRESSEELEKDREGACMRVTVKRKQAGWCVQVGPQIHALLPLVRAIRAEMPWHVPLQKYVRGRKYGL